MTTTEDIKRAIEQLARGELASVRAWFMAFDTQQFDATIDRGSQAGKLDGFAEEALAHLPCTGAATASR